MVELALEIVVDDADDVDDVTVVVVDDEGEIVVDVLVEVLVDVEAVVVEAGADVVNCHVDAEEIPVNKLPAVSRKAPVSMST